MNVSQYDWSQADAPFSHRYITEPILSMLPAKCNLKIADLGCGNGYLAGLLAEKGHLITALDSSEDGIRIAKEAYPATDFRCLSLYENIASHIGSDFDVVISSEVIEHLYDPRTFLRNASSVLKTGGTLILTTPYHGYIKNLAMAVTGKLDKHFTVGWDCGHIKFFSVITLTEMVAEQGFHNIHFKFAGRVPYLWKSMVLCAEK
jgi:2-polyprenyl-3-methyl-5-hydroxy-6-metoxy-1,4-benzoquinol methylase